MVREIRVSPDGDSVAIRTDNADGAWNGWAVMNAINGGHWASGNEVEDWVPLDVATEGGS